MTDFSSSIAKSCDFNGISIDPDLLNDNLSSTIGTETLLAHDMVPEGLSASSKRHAEQQVHHIGGARCLVVD
jgi:hypothetical protein